MRDIMRLVEAFGEVDIKRTGEYRAPASALDYPGVDFAKFAIRLDGQRIGEVEVQHDGATATIRNVIIYRPDQTGKGIGQRVYTALRDEFPGYELRSSYEINSSNGVETTGLSDQARTMWDALVAKGRAEKMSGDRPYYRYLEN